MARKLRLEFPGAIYHVINRGNYKTWIFSDAATRTAFQGCLFEACERSNWLLHAYTIMSNHYHLALETPAANLVSGMQWLESTFANRFNRFRREHGHVFQGRYKSIVVESGTALGHVCDYIHLNAVRAGVVQVARLSEYHHSSYPFLRRSAGRPKFLRVGTALEALGLIDEPAGWHAYLAYLAWQAADGPAGRNAAYVSMSRGWAIGSDAFKAALVQDNNLTPIARAWEVAGAREIEEIRWHSALASALQRFGRDESDCRTDRKSASWKIAVAAHLKLTTQATNRWLTEKLHMGTPVAVSQYVSAFRRAQSRPPEDVRQLTEKLKA